MISICHRDFELAGFQPLVKSRALIAYLSFQTSLSRLKRQQTHSLYRLSISPPLVASGRRSRRCKSIFFTSASRQGKFLLVAYFVKVRRCIVC